MFVHYFHSVYVFLSRMIDWLSWPLAQHVDTWVIALLKGLAAVQKFTILIDVTLLKIELVCTGNAVIIKLDCITFFSHYIYFPSCCMKVLMR